MSAREDQLHALCKDLYAALASLDQALENELGGFYLSAPGHVGAARDHARKTMAVIREAKEPTK